MVTEKSSKSPRYSQFPSWSPRLTRHCTCQKSLASATGPLVAINRTTSAMLVV